MISANPNASGRQTLKRWRTGVRGTNYYRAVARTVTASKRTRFYQRLSPLIIALRRTRACQTVKHWWKLFRYSEYRQADRVARADFRQFRNHRGGIGLGRDVSPRGAKAKTVLVVRNAPLSFMPIESFVWKALQMAGLETVVLGERRYDFLRYDWLAGNKMVVELNDFGTQGDPEWVDRQMSALRTVNDWVALEYHGVHVGRFVIALAQRRFRGRLDLSDPAIQKDLRAHLAASVRNTIAAARMLEEIRPDCVVVNDRGYSGPGEIFDLAINQGIDTLTWHVGYKSNRLVFKRYHVGNERDHLLAPSADSWRRMCSTPWSAEHSERIRRELFECYETQDWFSNVGTQFDKKLLSQELTRQKLGLSSDKKVAVIFPHILWDGSFFSGIDLFSDYTQWFEETIRAASANPRLQWVVKLHPAHVVKAKQMDETRRPLELDVIERVVGKLPENMKLVYPDTDLSTYCLFQIADYAVTVRGTVGIESSLFGTPAVTAGTGRYDRRGFTLDSSTREEYLRKLATLETYPRLSPEQIQLAERYAYGVFLGRPLCLSSLSLTYDRDGKATPNVEVHCKTREQWLAAPDMRKLAAWVVDRKLEDMLEVPL